MAQKYQGLEGIVNANDANNNNETHTDHTILKAIGSYIANNTLLTTGMVLWLPRLSLIALYTTKIEGVIGDDIANEIEYASWAAATLSYIPWGLHGAGLKTYREAWEHYKENGFKGLAAATGKGLWEDFKFLCLYMPKHIADEAPQYLTRLQDLYGKTKKHMPGTKS